MIQQCSVLLPSAQGSKGLRGRPLASGTPLREFLSYRDTSQPQLVALISYVQTTQLQQVKARMIYTHGNILDSPCTAVGDNGSGGNTKFWQLANNMNSSS